MVISTITAMSRKRRAGGATSSAHLSPGGRGRPREARAGEGVKSKSERADPPHPSPLPNGEREQAGAQGTNSSAAALYRLMAWLSPAYPVGAFSYSSGIEW